MRLRYQIRSRVDIGFPPSSVLSRGGRGLECYSWRCRLWCRERWTMCRVKTTSGTCMVTVEAPSTVVPRQSNQVRRRAPEATEQTSGCTRTREDSSAYSERQRPSGTGIPGGHSTPTPSNEGLPRRPTRVRKSVDQECSRKAKSSRVR